MDAEIIAVGTELLLGQTVDTNSAEISESLAQRGINLFYHSIVGDNPVRLSGVLAQALTRSALVVITGGLGPTEDDITKEVLAAVSGRSLNLDPQALAHVEGYFKTSGREMTQNNRRQAMLPEGAVMLDNPRGTAPGVYLQVGRAHVFCLPGVPTEMRTMLADQVLPRLGTLVGGAAVIHSRTLRFYGIGESSLETRVQDLLHKENPTVAPYAGVGEVRLRITARADSQRAAEELIRPVERELRERVGEYLYGLDDDTLEGVVGRLLHESEKTVAVAESCTGGLVAHRMTNVAGSSVYFRQGWVTYSNEAKVKELGVDPSTLKEYGAVSERVACMMAEGALRESGADLAVSTTGIAGPGGGSDEKPVGLVYFGVAGDGPTRAFSRQLRGSREDIKWRSANEALNLLRLALRAQE